MIMIFFRVYVYYILCILPIIRPFNTLKKILSSQDFEFDCTFITVIGTNIYLTAKETHIIQSQFNTRNRNQNVP